jgi:hypothetical protein
MCVRSAADQPPLCSVYKRYKEISRWLKEVRSILEVTQPLEELAQLQLPSTGLLPTINTPSVCTATRLFVSRLTALSLSLSVCL